MFQPSSRPIDPVLRAAVAEIEQSPALSVLAARQFRYTLSQTSVEVTISQPRRFNVLEEFILRAGIDLKPSPTQDELASILGLDPIFINSTATNLRKLNTLEKSTESNIQLTALGEELYKYQILPDSTKNIITQVYILLDSLSNHIALTDKPLVFKDIDIDNLKDLADFVEIENEEMNFDNLSLTEFHDLLRNNKLSCHDPEDNKIVSNFELVNDEIIWTPVSLFVIFDTLENNIRIEARRDAKVLTAESKLLNNLLEQHKVSLDTLCDLTDEEVKYHCEQTSKYKNEEVEKRIAILTEVVRAQNQPNLQFNNDGTVLLLRDGSISQEFENILNSAKHQVLIYSPWVSKSIIDDRFIKRLQKLADNGVWILIGHGIARSQMEEDRPIPPEVEARLRSILSPGGIPAVQVFWLGGSHAKEIIADRKVHLLGSNNLLSCRASSGLWAESAYKVTIAKQVQEAYEFYAGRFRSKAKELWSQASQHRDFELAKQAIYLWGALEMEEEALLNVQSSNWSELYPVWSATFKRNIS